MESKSSSVEKSKRVLKNIVIFQVFYFLAVITTYLMRMSVLVDVVYLLFITVAFIILSISITYAYLYKLSSVGVTLVDRMTVFILIQVPSSLVFAFTMIVFLGAGVIYD